MTDIIENPSLNFHYVNTIEDIIESISFLNSDKKLKKLSIYNSDFENLSSMFESIYTKIEAAGGLIKNKNGELLFIFRRRKWDLPKGKIDEGETAEIAALREVEEETGLKNIEIKNLRTHTYHTYIEKGRKILKKTHWFDMQYLDDDDPIPQAEEDISIAKWLNPEKLDEIRQNTYNSILDALETKK